MTQQRSRNIVYNLSFALNCLLVFFLLFESRLQVPAWLQVFGRMHPLLLHFPIVLLIVTLIFELFFARKKEFILIIDWLLLTVSLTAALTSLMGLMLSVEGGYEEDSIALHKYGGVAISLITLAWYAFRDLIRTQRIAGIAVSLVSIFAILITGHEGANLTHGEDFLLAPISKDKERPAVLLEDAVVFNHMVMPILEDKCISCHNSGKAKGELVMETAALLLKGGKNGALWDTSAHDLGLMFQRIGLPLEKKEHMPPKGKPQLTGQEIEILERWVRKGANFELKVVELPEEDTLRQLANVIFNSIETDKYDFASADEKTIQSLNDNYRIVYPLSLGSPALGVEFFSAAQYNASQLKELEKVKEQIVALNLNKMPVKDEDLKIIASFKNLRKLNLSFTGITSKGVAALSSLKELKSLSVSGTDVDGSSILHLKDLPNLSNIYAWNTKVDENSYSGLKKQFPKTYIEKGFNGDTIVISLNAPSIENEEQIIREVTPLKMKHVIRDVAIHYTTDGSEPDSLSPVYKNDVAIDRSMTIRARAYKAGWKSSAVLERSFFKSTYKPDTAALLKSPNPNYKGDGAVTIMNLEKGDLNFRSGKWLGYKENPMETMLYFNKPVKLSSVSVSSLIDIPSYIMPPKKIEVWGGKKNGQMHLLKVLEPIQPDGDKPGYLFGFNLQFEPREVECVKLVVTPVPKLPSWHRGKGEQAWIFVDEVFFN